MKDNILWQLDMVWQLFCYHMKDLGEQEAHWAQSEKGLRVRQQEGCWLADWPETESYDIGPASIAWTLWHILFWWESALAFNRDGRTLEKTDVVWPGSVALAERRIAALYGEWVAFLNIQADQELEAPERARWPFEGQSLAAVALWLNAEFMKNTAELGAARFLYATRSDRA